MKKLDTWILEKLIDPATAALYARYEKDNFYIFDVFYAMTYFFILASQATVKKELFDRIMSCIFITMSGVAIKYVMDGYVTSVRLLASRGFPNMFRSMYKLRAVISFLTVYNVIRTAIEIHRSGLELWNTFIGLSAISGFTAFYFLAANFPINRKDDYRENRHTFKSPA